MKKIVVIFLTLSILTGCAAQRKLTRHEYIALREKYDQLRTKVYKNISKEQVLDAIEKLFNLADDDYQISYGKNGCIAYRNWCLYLVFAAAFGKDYWYILVNENMNETKVTIREVTQSTAFVGTATGNGGAQITTFPSMINPDIIDEIELKTRDAMYTLFFKRLDFLLGMSNEWLDCKKARQYMRDNNIKGNLDPFCVVASDRKPEIN